jgi:putative membrane protein
MKKFPLLKQFNWRALLVRILINAAVLAVTALILPNVYFVEVTVWNILFIAIALGVLNAVIKPILQFLTLSFIFTTYGVVVILINAVILWSLSFLFPDRFAVHSILAALLGGALIGILGSFFESLLGLSPPIVPDEQDESRLRKADPTPVVTKMILKTGQGEEPRLVDPATPLLASQENGLRIEALVQPEGEEVLMEPVDRVSPPPPPDIALEAEEPGEQEVAEDAAVTEEEPIAAEAGVEGAESPDLVVEPHDDVQNETSAQAEENESWQ